ncbi:lactonase family protein [Protaetiibacter larvae]|uniref:Lactonase family protein n=1 Tax=Protaetiibacter larvae TaxID=2592654 RepID=A0A5C1Y5U8_9MICO|nr:beta-propeller fold lactonase family protein [Protaetiibacter larvae]QEO09413.1 lactonase family protein [Protaetiibacter larvae]
MRFHVGSYSRRSPWAAAPDGHGEGIALAELSEESGALELVEFRFDDNPAYIDTDPRAARLWTVTELETGGALHGYEVDADGTLGRRTGVDTGADAPCHVTADLVHDLAYVAHYQGARFSVLALDDGLPASLVEVHEMPGVVAGVDRRDARPRPHSSLVIGDHVLMADCGRDSLLLFRIHGRGADARLSLAAELALPERTGPRHLAAGRGGIVYVSNQNTPGISVIEVTVGADPALRVVQLVASPGLGRAAALTSEVAVHPTLPIVYLANRRDESLSVFDIVAEDGSLALRESVDVLGAWPRHFRVTPDGGFLLVANQNSDEVVSFAVDERGGLSWTGHRLGIPTPTMIRYW